jgi:hypothetical protein
MKWSVSVIVAWLRMMSQTMNEVMNYSEMSVLCSHNKQIVTVIVT